MSSNNKNQNLSKANQNYVKWSLIGLVFIGIFVFLIYKDNEISENNSIVENNTENVSEGVDENPILEEDKKEEYITEGEVKDDNVLEGKNLVLFESLLKKADDAFLQNDYGSSIRYYTEALSYDNSDRVYMGLYNVYMAQSNFALAKNSIDTAIILNPTHADYWISKLLMMNERFDISFSDLQEVFYEGLTKVERMNKVNLVTSFARIAEERKLYAEAISLWEYAKALYPQNGIMYDEEINRLRNF